MKVSWSAVLLAGLVVGGFAGYGIAVKSRLVSPVAVAPPESAATCSAGNAIAPDALFVLDGRTYKKSDLPEGLRAELYEGEHEGFERSAGAIKTFATQLALASAKNSKVDPANLPPLEELLGPVKISDNQAKAFFEQNAKQMPPGAKFDEFKDRIKTYLAQDGRGRLLRERMTEMEKAGRLKMLLQEPEAPTVSIDVKDFPARGPSESRNVLIEISDYQCPHCKNAQPEIEALLKAHGTKLKFVQINFALRPEGLSGTLARGAYCASQQGDEKFWMYHSAAFNIGPDEKSESALKQLAQKASLNHDKLLQCVESPAAKAFVEQTVTLMNRSGIKGTPVFVLNKKRLGHGSITEAVVQALQ